MKLIPAQQHAFDGLIRLLPIGEVFVVFGGTGMGKTTVLRQAQAATGGVYLSMRDFHQAMAGRHPLAIEEALIQVIRDGMEQNDTVIVDDLHLLTGVIDGGCGHYPKPGLVNAPLTALVSDGSEAGKKLIFGMEGSAPDPIANRCYYFGIEALVPEDYEQLCGAFLPGETSKTIDYRKVHRFAPKLNAHQLKGACAWIASAGKVNTDDLIEYLRTQRLVSNVQLGEVQAVDLKSLKGIDDVIESLEANIIFPLENDEMANELMIKPKRGVLLAGPPGTGKTTVGRALAHRLRSKFFLVDGTFISGTASFYGQIHHVFRAAKDNAPSVIFIDDSDVIFENNQESGLYRYLLTMLDGLESKSAGRVCVMMTAMNVGNLPPALVHSGRIELWLETRPPDENARRAILAEHVTGLPEAFAGIDTVRLAGATEGFTGADMKRLMEDGKILFAYDKMRNRPLREVTEYFLDAAKAVKVNKERYERAEAEARARPRERPSWFDPSLYAFDPAGEEDE